MTVPAAVEAYDERPLNPARVEALRRFSGTTLLDVGCGNGGYVLSARSDQFAIGADYRMFDAWSARTGAFVVADATRLPFRDASFDTVSAFEVLEHLDDPDTALTEYLRVCRQNVIVTVPNCDITDGMRRSGLIYHHWIDPTHVNFWSLEQAKERVAAAGFRIDQAYAVNHIDARHFVAEAFTGHRITRALLRRALRVKRHRPYPMTSLIVGSKT